MTFSANTGAVRIQAMAAADVDAVMNIAGGLETTPHWTRAAYEAAFDAQAAPPRVALVAELDGRIVGFTVASVIVQEAELETIGVLPDCQRAGAGRALLAALFRELEARGIGEIMLEVRASNLVAQAFYRAHGFVESGRRPSYYPDTGEAAILMRAHIPIRLKNT